MKWMNLTRLIAALVFGVQFVNAQSSNQTAVMIFVDNSGSTKSVLADQIAISKGYLRRIGEGTPVFVFGFATDPVSKTATLARGVQCETNQQIVSTQLDQVVSVVGQTRLIDGLFSIVELFENDGFSDCKGLKNIQILLISDGEDRASSKKLSELVSKLKATAVVVNAIGVISELSDERGFLPQSSRQRARDFLNRLTKESGGRVVFAKRGQNVAVVLDEFFQK